MTLHMPPAQDSSSGFLIFVEATNQPNILWTFIPVSPLNPMLQQRGQPWPHWLHQLRKQRELIPSDLPCWQADNTHTSQLTVHPTLLLGIASTSVASHCCTLYWGLLHPWIPHQWLLDRLCGLVRTRVCQLSCHISSGRQAWRWGCQKSRP